MISRTFFLAWSMTRGCLLHHNGKTNIMILVLSVWICSGLSGQVGGRIQLRDGRTLEGMIADVHRDPLRLTDSAGQMVRLYREDIRAIDPYREVRIQLMAGDKISGRVYHSCVQEALKDSTLAVAGYATDIEVTQIKRIRWRRPPRASMVLGGLLGGLVGVIPALAASNPESEVPGIVYALGLTTIGAVVGNWATMESIPIQGNYPAYLHMAIAYFPYEEPSPESEH